MNAIKSIGTHTFSLSFSTKRWRRTEKHSSHSSKSLFAFNLSLKLKKTVKLPLPFLAIDAPLDYCTLFKEKENVSAST